MTINYNLKILKRKRLLCIVVCFFLFFILGSVISKISKSDFDFFHSQFNKIDTNSKSFKYDEQIINELEKQKTVTTTSNNNEDYQYPLYQPFKQSTSLIEKESKRFKCQSYLTQDIQGCDFPLNETKQVQEFIFNQQNPPDCDKAKLLINVGQWYFGIGSNIFIRSIAFVLAVSEGRVLVQDGEEFWAQQSCENKTYECWLKPTTKCSLPANWRSLNKI